MVYSILYLMIAYLSSFDKQITQFINTFIPHTPFFDTLFSFLSLIGGPSLFIWIIIVVFLMFFEEKKDIRFAVYFFSSMLLTVLLTNGVLKNIFARQRPFSPPYGCPTDFSFPSGHASIAFAAAFILASFDTKRKYIYYSIASLIALSRIYLGCHYVSDVVSGAILGILISFFVLSMGYLIHKRRSV